MLWAGILNFKLRIVFWILGDLGKRIALSEKNPPLGLHALLVSSLILYYCPFSFILKLNLYEEYFEILVKYKLHNKNIHMNTAFFLLLYPPN